MRHSAIIAIALITLAILLAQTRPAVPPSPRPVAVTSATPDPYALTADEFFKQPETRARITKDGVDISLLEVAIFQQTNRQRAAEKLPLFKHGWAMSLMARRHSQEMSDLQYFEHESPTPANRTLTDRLRNVGLVNVTAGENINVQPAKEMGSGSYIITTNDDGSETLTDEKTGLRIDYYTYEELAHDAVARWMNSPPHRANIVDRRFLYLGVGVCRGPYENGQDSFYMTQNFCASLAAASETKARNSLTPPKSQTAPAGIH